TTLARVRKSTLPVGVSNLKSRVFHTLYSIQRASRLTFRLGSTRIEVPKLTVWGVMYSSSTVPVSTLSTLNLAPSAIAAKSRSMPSSLRPSAVCSNSLVLVILKSPDRSDVDSLRYEKPKDNQSSGSHRIPKLNPTDR